MAKFKSTRSIGRVVTSREFTEEDYSAMWSKDQLIVKMAEALKVAITVNDSKDGKTAYVSNETVSLLDAALFE